MGSWRQLLALGFKAREIEHRVARRRLHLVMRGVYAVGWPRLTQDRRWMAAVPDVDKRDLRPETLRDSLDVTQVNRALPSTAF